MKVTVREVAKAAEVSVGTVSRVLNGDPTVGSDNVDRVTRIISSLNYHPLRVRSKPSEDRPLNGKNVALVLLGMDRSLVSLPVVAAAIHGAEAAIAKAGASVFLANVPDLDQPSPVLERHRLDGVILKGALQGNAIGETHNSLLDRLRRLPSVWILGKPNGCWGDVVSANDMVVGRIAADQLHQKGHRRFAFINPKSDHVTFSRRELSFTWRAQELGATVQRFVGTHPEQWELPLRPTRDVASVQELVDAMLACNPRPTAVFAPGDSIAALVYRALSARGLRVGRDISVISCNNERTLNSGLYPSLATIDTHAEMIGARAVELLASRLSQSQRGPAVELAIEPEFIAGDSVHSLN